MIQDLENLIKLQEIDLRIKEQEIAKEQYPATVLDLEKQIKKTESIRAAVQNKLDQLTNGIKDIDDQTAKARDSLSKSQERLNTIKTNREYDAVHKEIEAQKSLLGSSEGRKKSLESDIEKQKNVLEEAKNIFTKTKEELQPQIDELNAKIGSIDSNIAQITRERELVSPLVSKHTQRTYDSIRSKRKNGRVVSLVNSSKICSVCSVILRPQLLNEVRRGSKIILCETCGSMLIWDEQHG
ncbi:MAG: C4-type zinc ribbon domain-containing protein [Chitinispirillales bacterium]|jgi:predicted  nucleic acid-binding Zn-ribbon protein|nr:C4-type zinc ribbon domain-containing protein [Chitinispirillales bacterium]